MTPVISQRLKIPAASFRLVLFIVIGSGLLFKLGYADAIATPNNQPIAILMIYGEFPFKRRSSIVYLPTNEDSPLRLTGENQTTLIYLSSLPPLLPSPRFINHAATH